MTPEEFSRLRREVSGRAATIMAQQYRSLETYHERDVARFVAQAQPVLQGSQRAVGQLAAQFTRDDLARITGREVAPLIVPARALTDLRQGVSTAEELRRPFVQTWHALGQGLPLEEAVDAGVRRVEGMVEMDLQNTHAVATAAAQAAIPKEIRPRYWRRELYGDINCALCVLASTRRYHLAELNPIHPGCDCRVRMIAQGEWDTTRELDDELLARVREAVREVRGDDGTKDAGGKFDYRKVVTNITAVHGEHAAPLLVMPRHQFTRYQRSNAETEKVSARS